MAGETFYGEKWKLPYTAQQLQDAATNQVPRIGASGNWEVWDISTSAWVDTGVAADPQTAKIDADDIAPVETASTASQNYAVNSFLVYGAQLYRVTAAIAQGDTLTVGTNIAAADVGTYLAMVAAANAVANAGVAPGGFGLGTTVVNVENANDIDGCGFYRAKTNTPTNSTWYILNLKYNDTYRVQYGIDVAAFSYHSSARRIQYGGVWGEWEWIEPQMQVNAEYRTTERFLGKPVYMKVVNGTMPDTTADQTVAVGFISLGVTNLDRIISVTGTVYGTSNTPTFSLPMKIQVASSWWWEMTACGDAYNNRIVVTNNRTKANVGTLDGYFLVKYTKSTD